jgi:hypothetical protein
MAHIPTLAPLVPKADGRTVRPEPKRADPFYETNAHLQFRDAVLARASYRCDWVENGERCARAAPRHRLFADHIKERQDGGDPFDPANGQCLCGSHHTRKTAAERAARLGRTRG